MPFASRELSVLAYANGFTFWHYRTTDPIAALTGGNGRYFAAADELLRPGDQILVSLCGELGAGGCTLVVRNVSPGVAVEVSGAGCANPEPVNGSPESAAAAELPLAAAG